MQILELDPAGGKFTVLYNIPPGTTVPRLPWTWGGAMKGRLVLIDVRRISRPRILAHRRTRTPRRIGLPMPGLSAKPCKDAQGSNRPG
ncbi:hypothetical protein ACFQ36_18315 [Arthrobacter sp. GCM10027362]|uniref:hypothetical protein n=1 Tax=Arthrobacter sp. GCM10027362 TaxID=3273379 RepID=UPI00362B60DB